MGEVDSCFEKKMFYFKMWAKGTNNFCTDKVVYLLVLQAYAAFFVYKFSVPHQFVCGKAKRVLQF
ncbi:MAG: hypothetical protein IJ417_05280, partial [Bacteroidaceae bacterium]|nr:hypothetical protein [Bacteroidaceae bacterium]